MECNIYDSSLKKIGILSSFISMTWNEQYSDVGSFMIAVYKDSDTLQYIRKGNFVAVRPYDTLMYIYSVEDKNNQLWAYGAEAKVLLQRKIYNGKLTCKNIETTLKTAVSEKNDISIIGVAENKGLTAKTDSQRSYSSLFDLSKTWCDFAGYGFRLTYDRKNRSLLYDIYEGEYKEDVVFAEKYGNLYNLRRSSSQKQWANVAYVAGAGEGEYRKVVVCGATDTTGFERSEIFVDARDLQMEEGQTESEYEAILLSRGLETLANYNEIDELDFEIETSGFGTDYKLGDIVSCLLPEYGLKLSIRICGFTTVYENNKTTTKLQLGIPILRSVI